MIFLLVLFLISSPALSGEKKFSKDSHYLTGQIGIQSYDATSEPFNRMLPFYASYEVGITDNLGIGGTAIFYKWSDYLGMFGGKFTFHVFKPSLDVAYHFDFEKMEIFNLFAGASFGYSVLSVSNELGNAYEGDLAGELHIAPFLGTRIHVSDGISACLKIFWSVAGNFSGVSLATGITFRIK